MRSQQKQRLSPPSMLAKGAFAIAAAALALSLWTALKTPEANLPAKDSDDTVETGSIAATATPSSPVGTSPTMADQQLDAFDAIDSRVTALEQQQSEAGASTGDSSESMSGPDSIDEPSWRYVNLTSPEPSVEVRQGRDGSMYAINSDPALTGTVIEIEAHRADGSIETMTISVPKPDY